MTEGPFITCECGEYDLSEIECFENLDSLARKTVCGRGEVAALVSELMFKAVRLSASGMHCGFGFASDGDNPAGILFVADTLHAGFSLSSDDAPKWLRDLIKDVERLQGEVSQ